MITFDHVSFTYPGASRPALEKVTLGFSRGEITLVTGRLESGCSTLLLIAAGLVTHLTAGKLTGTVRVLGVEAGTQAAHREIAGRVGLLLPTPWTQLSGVAFSVADEVAFGPANLGRPRDRIAKAVDRAMSLANVGHLADRDPATLSGGELQRVMLAGIIALEPEVYLLDRLLVAGVIEARGCERFQLLAAALEPDLAPLYAEFARNEARHAGLFVRLAKIYYAEGEVDARLEVLRSAEAEIMRALPLRPALH